MLESDTLPDATSDYLTKSEVNTPTYHTDSMDPITPVRPQALQQTLPLAAAGPAADRAAAQHVFADYRRRRAEETIRRQDADLALFASFLHAAGAQAPDDFGTNPDAWMHITWGMVAAFVEWQLREGYAVGSINVRLSTVKAYAKLTTRAGTMPAETYAQIKLVSGMRHAEGKRIDKQRDTTRTGAKKATPTPISPEQAAQLKQAADPRDRLLICLLLDHGLRVGEVVLLTPRSFDLRRGLLRFERPKVDKRQTHRLSKDTRAAAEAYLPDGDPDAPIFPGDRQIRYRVKQLGSAVGLQALSPHDARHFWATQAIAHGTDLKSLQDAGGWNSPAMPLRYALDAEIANDGVRLE